MKTTLTIAAVRSAYALALLVLFGLAPPARAAGNEPVMATVMAGPVDRGQVIQESDVTRQAVPPALARGGLAPSAIIGQEARRLLQPGQVVRSYDVKVPDLVRRDQTVTMLVTRGRLSIAAVGKALQAGPEGGIIRVQNISSKQIIEAEIIAEGTVQALGLGMNALRQQ